MTRSHYTDIDNVGAPMVPLLSCDETDAAATNSDPAVLFGELVWHYRPAD